MMLAPIVALIFSLAAVGCSTLVDPQVELGRIEIPGAYAGAAAAEPGRPPTLWWREFRDPRLAGLIEEALGANQDLRAAASRVLAAAAEARIAGAEQWPTVDLGVAGERRKQNFVAFGGVLPATTIDVRDIAFSVSWELDLWGRLAAGSDAARFAAEASAADLEALRLSLAASVARAWFALTEAGEQLALAEGTTDSYRSTAEQVRLRYQRGVRSALDLRLALNELAAAEAVVAARRQSVDAAVRRLEVLLGRYPDGALDADRVLPEPPVLPAPGVPSELVSRRPDVQAAELRLRTSSARVREADASLYPRVGLGAGTGWQAGDFSDLLKDSTSVWNLAANLAQPIFQGGRLLANVDRAQAAEQAAAADFVSRVLSAFGEVESALAAERHLCDRERHLADAVRHSEAARSLADLRYRSGLEDYVTVLASQRSEFTARSAWISVRRERLDRRVDLYLALGGAIGTETPEPVSGVATDQSAQRPEQEGAS
jgi:multidrug efflux system outer membrane protein